MARKSKLNFFNPDNFDSNPVRLNVGSNPFMPEVDFRNLPINPPDTGLTRLRTRQTPDITAYKDFLKSTPDRANYKQSKLGAILGGIAGFTEGMNKGPTAAYEVTKGIADRPYSQALEEHTSKGARLKELADLEYRGLTDEQKLEVQIAEDVERQHKRMMDMIKTESDLKKTDAEIRNISSQIQNRNLSLQRSDVDGQLYVIDQANKTITPLGKFAETVGEKREAEHKFFKNRHAVEQAGRVALQNDAQAHARDMEGIRFGFDKQLAEFRSKLENENSNISATQSNAAFDGAMTEILFERPELKDQLFQFDDDGNLILKPDVDGKKGYNPQVYSMFTKLVKDRANAKLGKGNDNDPNRLFPGLFGASSVATPSVTLPPSNSEVVSETTNSDEIEVIDKNGVEGTIPREQLQEALAEGYRVKNPSESPTNESWMPPVPLMHTIPGIGNGRIILPMSNTIPVRERPPINQGLNIASPFNPAGYPNFMPQNTLR